jgi:hypothetical protein
MVEVALNDAVHDEHLTYGSLAHELLVECHVE